MYVCIAKSRALMNLIFLKLYSDHRLPTIVYMYTYLTPICAARH